MQHTDNPHWQDLPAREAPTPEESRRPRWKRISWLVVAVLLLAAVPAYHLISRAAGPFGARGHFFIVGAENFTAGGTGSGSSLYTSREGCIGAGEYGGLGINQPFDITDTDGTVLASGPVFEAGAGTDPSTGADICELVFDIADVPSGHDRYVVSFYGRYAHEFSKDQLRDGFVIRSDGSTGSAPDVMSGS